ncbi:MAG: protein rarD [Actinobacteria bacterium 13_2_20CM_2_71_6]|nr:MAG: protein rarD [Actinobacteria bacterium 13_2_20CM_2_71_6]
MGELRRGYLFGIAAYVLWGFFPLYFKLLRPAGPLEILAHRVVWSALFVGLLLTIARSWRRIRDLLRRPRTVLVVGLAAVLIAVNWGTYIYGVNTARIVETSLGYFITPLISVAFGLAVFGERLRPAQWGALAAGTAAVAVLTVDYGRPPWIALTLAVSFASYGLVKKRLGLPATDGLFVESAALALPALGYLAWLTAVGHGTFVGVSAWHTVLLLISGAVTAVPLLLFAGSANRIPMTGLGILQYIAPILQFFVGVAIEHEPMPPARLFGFALVWLALAAFTWDALRHARRSSRGAVPEPATAT